MGRLVLLRHDTPDGGQHFDLMLERHAGDERLLTFRLDRRIKVGAVGRARAELLGEHRAAYLTYEGEVSGGRGRVRREWSAEGDLGDETSDRVRIRVKSGGVIELRSDGNAWSVEVQTSETEQDRVKRVRSDDATMGDPERG